ncbi:MAG: M23 family metallopeptidase [Halioglobus sp.]
MTESEADFTTRGLDGELERFAARISNREQQLAMLESLLTNRKLSDQGSLSGLPVKHGYVSSGYGWRTDPINGKRALHNGLDFAGKAGSEVVAAASGVVTFTGRDAGYGNVVEVSHGDNYVTRYAHNKQNLVKPGDIVRKGDTIALMGSSGRSTGSHALRGLQERALSGSVQLRGTHSALSHIPPFRTALPFGPLLMGLPISHTMNRNDQ